MPGAAGIAVRAAHQEGAGLLVHRFWSKVAAGIVLGRDERRRFAALAAQPPMSAAGWLLARLAAKDAVRTLLGLDLPMADVAIGSDAHGAPCVVVAPAGRTAPRVGLSHKGFLAVAAAAPASDADGVGIDVEPLAPLDPALAADAFDERERALLAAAATAPFAPFEVAGWAAKEAIGKALGRGLPGGPRDLTIIACDGRAGRIACRLAGRLARAFPERAGRDFEALVRVHDRHVIALCRIPAGS